MSAAVTPTKRKADVLELAERDDTFRKRVKKEFPGPKPYSKDDPIVQYVCIVAVDVRKMTFAYVPRDELTGSEMMRLKYVHRVGHLKPKMDEDDFLLKQLLVAFKTPLEALRKQPENRVLEVIAAQEWEAEYGKGEYGRWHKYVNSAGAVHARDIYDTFVYHVYQPWIPYNPCV